MFAKTPCGFSQHVAIVVGESSQTVIESFEFDVVKIIITQSVVVHKGREISVGFLKALGIQI